MKIEIKGKLLFIFYIRHKNIFIAEYIYLMCFILIGINVTYVWDFGDGTVQKTTSVKMVQKTYSTVGNYNLIVNISNSIQYKIIVQNVSVIDKFEFNGIEGNQFTELNGLTTLKLNLSGNRFICSWYLNGVLSKNDSMTQFDYMHIQSGVVVWNVTCRTPVETISRKLEQFVIERFTGQ